MEEISRRGMMAISAVMPWAATSACAQPTSTPFARGASTLVTYFTRSGNTKVIAGILQRALKADLFEIRPANPYPVDYEETVAQNHAEKMRGFEPPLAEKVAGIDQYDTIFLGFPIWDSTPAPPVRSFLKVHDLRGKVIRPFVTHGGYGLGDTSTVFDRYLPGMAIEPPFVTEADAERRTLTETSDWLKSIGA